MRAIIVDDEPKAIELLKGYLEKFTTIQLLGTFRNGLKAIDFLAKEKVDLIFLDIEMPHLTGLSLSKMLPKDIGIIFTTAYSAYAVDSYDVEAIDYLLKPISFERFAKAINKAMNNQQQPVGNTSVTVFVKSGSNVHRLETAEILFLQKDGNYMYYHRTDQKIMARESIAEALSKLPEDFLQVHKSFIVNLRKIDFFNKEEISLGANNIPIGHSFKVAFFEKMKP